MCLQKTCVNGLTPRAVLSLSVGNVGCQVCNGTPREHVWAADRHLFARKVALILENVFNDAGDVDHRNGIDQARRMCQCGQFVLRSARRTAKRSGKTYVLFFCIAPAPHLFNGVIDISQIFHVRRWSHDGKRNLALRVQRLGNALFRFKKRRRLAQEVAMQRGHKHNEFDTRFGLRERGFECTGRRKRSRIESSHLSKCQTHLCCQPDPLERNWATPMRSARQR